MVFGTGKKKEFVMASRTYIGTCVGILGNMEFSKCGVVSKSHGAVEVWSSQIRSMELPKTTKNATSN
jgi:hypothetical protein